MTNDHELNGFLSHADRLGLRIQRAGRTAGQVERNGNFCSFRGGNETDFRAALAYVGVTGSDADMVVAEYDYHAR